MKIIRKFKNFINRKCDKRNFNRVDTWNGKKLGPEKQSRGMRKKITTQKQNVTRKHRNRCCVTHHENHEPWLQVGAPDVSLRFQPPWWSPGWYPFPLHFDADWSLLFFFLHTQHSREKKKSRSHFSEITRALNFSLLVLFFNLPPKFGDANERTSKIIVEKSISGRILLTEPDFYCLRDRAKKCGSIFPSLVISRE